MSTQFTTTGEVEIRKIDFTPTQRLHIVAAAFMAEFTPDDAAEIQDFWDLLSYLHREKERLMKILITADKWDVPLVRQQLKEVELDLGAIQHYIDANTNQE